MSKAIQGAAMLAGAVGMGALAFFQPELLATPFYINAMGALALGGLSMEAGAIANALTGGRGQNITTRQAASLRQIIYGCQRVGGVQIYRSTSGSHHDQFNYCIVLATHECWGIDGLYLDGRKVYFDGNSSGHNYGVSQQINFGGSADGGTYTGPSGTQYNFGGKVYCEARYAQQLPGDVIGGFTANDPAWATRNGVSPYVGGCTYVYLKIEYDTTLFPQEPEIRFTIFGKPVYDPRIGAFTYSHNPALIINDILTDPEYGLGDVSVNLQQLIAAANLCEEQVALAASGTEDRYAAHWHYDTSVSPGDAISTIAGSMAGRLSRVGGEWYIWPGAYYGPSASFGADALTGPVQWSATRSYHELFNRVTGTYTAPNYPYNTAGDLYDSNGWYNGQIQNNFPFAFQQTNYPEYACDVLHGYPADEYMTEDTDVVGLFNAAGYPYFAGDVVSYLGTLYEAVADTNSSQMLPPDDPLLWRETTGTQLPKELGQPCVLSVAQAQRLAKIALLRNRQQGSGTLQMSLAAYQLQPVDTFLMTFAQNGWADKLLEVNTVHFELQTSGETPQIQLMLGVNETAASVWEWSTTEELTVYDVPAVAAQAPATPAAPTNVVLTSSAATALLQPDGSVLPRIEVTWDTPLDIRVTELQLQYQLVAAATWTDAGTVDVSLNTGYINGVVAGQQYDVRIRSVRASGAASAWVELDGFTAGLVLSIQSQDGIGVGSLIGEAYTNGTAAIECQSFTALLGNQSISYFPGGPVTLSGLTQQSLYYVYLVDGSATGGNLTPVATQSKSDYLGKLGYWLIDSLVTPYASGGGGGTGMSSRYYPTVANDQGTRTTLNAGNAYDGDTSTYATVSASATSDTEADGDCLFQGFPAIGLAASSTLTVIAAAFVINSGEAAITATMNGTAISLIDVTTTTAQATYTYAVPANTPLSSIVVEVTAEATATGGDGTEAGASPQDIQDPGNPNPTPARPSSCRVNVTEIYIQT